MMLNKLNSTVKCVYNRIEFSHFPRKCKGFEIVRDSLHHLILRSFSIFFLFCLLELNFQFTHLSSSPFPFLWHFFSVHFFAVVKCGQLKRTKDLDIEFSIARYIWNSIAILMHECKFRTPKWAQTISKALMSCREIAIDWRDKNKPMPSNDFSFHLIWMAHPN